MLTDFLIGGHCEILFVVNVIVYSSEYDIRILSPVSNLFEPFRQSISGSLGTTPRRLTSPISSMADDGETTADTEEPSQPMPKLSSPEFKIYNSMAEHMDVFVHSSAVRIS